jgi:hypothetical protein
MLGNVCRRRQTSKATSRSCKMWWAKARVVLRSVGLFTRHNASCSGKVRTLVTITEQVYASTEVRVKSSTMFES